MSVCDGRKCPRAPLQIASRIEELADEVAAAYGDAPITLLCVLKGSISLLAPSLLLRFRFVLFRYHPVVQG